MKIYSQKELKQLKNLENNQMGKFALLVFSVLFGSALVGELLRQLLFNN